MSSPAAVIAFVVGLVVIFALAIAWGLRSRGAYFDAAASSADAATLWTRFGVPGLDREAMLYGVPTDFSMTDTGWIVKDAHDREVGRIHATGAFRFEIGSDSYRAAVRKSLPYRMELRRAGDNGDDPAGVVCALDITGSFGAKVARFSPSGGGALDLPRPMGWPKERKAITRDGAEIGVVGVMNVNRPVARMVVLPGAVPVVVRMFVLALG